MSVERCMKVALRWYGKATRGNSVCEAQKTRLKEETLKMHGKAVHGSSNEIITKTGARKLR